MDEDHSHSCTAASFVAKNHCFERQGVNNVSVVRKNYNWRPLICSPQDVLVCIELTACG
jgi:hypothetical protein